MSGAERTRAYNNRRKDAGLIQIKVFVHPDDAPATRNYAARRPATKAVLTNL